MARSFNGINQQLLTQSTPVTAVPITIACWFYPYAAVTAPVVSIDTFEGNARYTLFINSSGDCAAASRNTTGTQSSAFTTGDYALNDWNHICGVYAANNDRTIYRNGGNSGQNLAGVTVTGTNRIHIAREYTDGALSASVYGGAIAEVGIWSIALTAIEVAILAKNISPMMVRPESLVFYAPLIGRYYPEIDTVGGLSLSQS